jgi:hypothetical protein
MRRPSPDAGQPCTAAQLNNFVLSSGYEVKTVSLLPDVSVRFKQLSAAVPQIAMNCSNFEAIPQDRT